MPDTETLWAWRDLCIALGLPPVSGPSISGFAIDSRRVRPGDLFIALPGDPGPRFNPSQRSNRDGHDFIDAALAAGAAGIMSHRPGSPVAHELRVADTLDGLWRLAEARRSHLSGPVLAITGSSGKTTAKTFLAAALNAFSLPGSFNNHLGVPLCLASTPIGCGAAVYEIGTNHPGEIEPLSRLVRPDFAIVLNVHPAHVGHFSGLQAIREEKLSIRQGLVPGGCLLVEASVAPDRTELAQSIRTFGSDAAADCQLLAASGNRARYRLDSVELEARVPGGGRHRALSLAAVLCTLDALGRPLSLAQDLPDSLVPAGRGVLRQVADVTLIDDSYNANPASMKAALLGLCEAPPASGRKWALLGEMLELGDASPRYHADLASACAGIDRIVAVGDGMQPLFDALPVQQRGRFQAQADGALLGWLCDALRAGDQVLIKGSNQVFFANRFVDRLAAALAGILHEEEGAAP